MQESSPGPVPRARPTADQQTADQQKIDQDHASTDPLSFAGLTAFMGRVVASDAASDDLVPGMLVGDVRIVRFLGAGGMGRVYQGVQVSTQQTVAVKVISQGIVSVAAARRLAHEAQILGRLSHSGIARIFSAGVAQITGRDMPYFVMEYVEEPRSISAFVIERNLSRRERVQLFRQVCSGVAHGHERGIVHRDLKPGNILINARGQPKIIDFGVARSTADEGQLTTMHTGTGELLGTAQYMAPEQLFGTSDDIDARADIYALGIVFYELLTGSLPYEIRDRPIYEVARVVRDVEPRSLATVDRQLRGDLTAIVATCLDKDRGRRYPTAAALAGDLDRHLAGRPILARPPGFLESLVRLANRHRVAALGMAGILTTLVFAAVGMTLLAVRAERQRVIAASAANLAGQQLYRANVCSLQSFLESNNPQAARAIYDETMHLVSANPPLEIRCLGVQLDDALVVLQPTGRPVVNLSFSPDGHRLDAATVEWFPKPQVPYSSELGAIANRPGELRLSHSLVHDSYAIKGPGSVQQLAKSEAAQARRSLWTARDGEVVDVAPDGRRLVVNQDGGLVIERGPEGEVVASMAELRGRVERVAFAPGRGSMAVLMDNGQLDLWNCPWDGEMGAVGTTLDTGGPIMNFVFSPDGSRLATVRQDSGGKSVVCVFEITSGERLTMLQVKGSVSSNDLVVALSAAGDRLLISAHDNDIEIRTVADGMLERILVGHAAVVTAAVWSGDGRQIATADCGGRIYLWGAAAGDLQKQFVGHTGEVLVLAFAADDECLASGGIDGSIRIWSRSRERPFNTLPLAGEPQALAFSPNGKELALATAEGDLEVWDLAAVQRRLRLPLAGASVADVCYSPGGNLLAAAVNATDADGEIRIWDTVTGQDTAQIGGLEQGAVGAVFSDDATRIVTTAENGSVGVWSVAGPERLWQLGVGTSQSLGKPLAVFCLGGQLVACKHPWLFDSATGTQSHRLLRGQFWCQAVSPDGRVLVRGTALGRSYLVDCKTGQSLGFSGGHTETVLTAAFSRDSSLLVTGSADRTARVWDVKSATQLHVLKGHEGAVQMAVFTPDQRRVVTAAADGTARIWDAELGVELCQFPANAERPQTVAVSPDGGVLVTPERDDDGPYLKLRGLSNAAITMARRARMAAESLGRDPLIKVGSTDSSQP